MIPAQFNSGMVLAIAALCANAVVAPPAVADPPACSPLLRRLHADALAVAEAHGLVVAADSTNDMLFTVDIARRTVRSRVPVAGRPAALALPPGGSVVYSVNLDGGSVSAVDVLSGAEVATIPVGEAPRDIAVSPHGSELYVSESKAGSVSVIDTRTNSVSRTISVGGQPSWLAVPGAGRRVYVSDSERSTVSAIDAASGAVLRTRKIRFADALAASADGKRLYATHVMDNSVSVIGTSRLRTKARVGLRSAQPVAVAVAPDGRRVFTGDLVTGSVSVIDTAKFRKVASIPVEGSPVGLAMSIDGKRLYTANTIDGSVSIIDTAALGLKSTVPLGCTSAATVRPVARADKVRVRVLPDLGPGKQWGFVVRKKRAFGRYRVMTDRTGRPRVFRTAGPAHRRTLDLPRGTYKIETRSARGHRGTLGSQVRLRR